jgi:uncharacterized membrane protein YfcA
MLIVLVPVRRLFAHLRMHLSDPGLVASGAVYGVLSGGTSGAGVILMSMLMGAGLSGTQVIATDAAVSFLLGFVKSGTFMATGALPPHLWLIALLIGVMATPGTMIAKWLARKFTAQVHDTLLEAAIVVGGLVLLIRNISA